MSLSKLEELTKSVSDALKKAREEKRAAVVSTVQAPGEIQQRPTRREAPDLVLMEKVDRVMGLLRIHRRDDTPPDVRQQIMEGVDAEYRETPGLEEAVAREQITYLLLNRRGSLLPREAVEVGLKYGYFLEISEEEAKVFEARSKAVRTHRETVVKGTDHPKDCPDCRFPPFTDASKKDAAGSISHYVAAETAVWLKGVLKERYDLAKTIKSSWQGRLKKYGIDPRAAAEKNLEALVHIAMGEKIAAAPIILRSDPFTSDKKVAGKVVDTFVNFGQFIVNGLGTEESPDGLPELEIVPFEQDESPRMYHLLRPYFGGKFTYRPLRKGESLDSAFWGLQERSRKEIAGKLRVLLLKALGVKLRPKTEFGKQLRGKLDEKAAQEGGPAAGDEEAGGDSGRRAGAGEERRRDHREGGSEGHERRPQGRRQKERGGARRITPPEPETDD